MKWTTDHIPDLTDKTSLVTGANSGLGYEVALALAGKGARVLMTARDEGRGQAAVTAIKRRYPQAQLELLVLDLASLASIKNFAATVAQRYATLHVLCNNAGVMAAPQLPTADGFELQFGTNHLGHFALTGLLLPLLKRAPQARVVTVSSNMHYRGQMNFADLHSRQHYNEWTAYSQSKLANVLFAYELQRRANAHNLNLLSVGVHPGYVATNLQFAGARLAKSTWREAAMKIINRLAAGKVADGALPLLYACVSPDIRGGEFLGPSRNWEVEKQKSSAASYSEADAVKLWQISAELTGIEFDL